MLRMSVQDVNCLFYDLQIISLIQDLMQPGSDVVVFNLLRSLNWDDIEISSYTVMCLTDATNIGYLRIRALANVVSMLVDYQVRVTLNLAIYAKHNNFIQRVSNRLHKLYLEKCEQF